MKKACLIRCRGKVQGVFFRASTKERADQLGIKGWVRNEYNGDVLIHAESDEESIQKLLKWCNEGPPLAQVVSVDHQIVSFENYKEFKITF